MWHLLNNEIALYSKEGDINLTGDFNARTGVLPDFTTHDSNIHIPLPPEDVDQAHFNSDHLVNNYGKELCAYQAIFE